MKTNRLLFLLAPALLLSSCIITMLDVHPHRVPFDEADFAGYDRAGSATVSGQLLVMIDGALRSGDRVDMELLPVNPYTTEMVERELAHGERLFASPAAFKKYRREVRSDAQGQFVFTGVPAGEYYVYGCVKWNDQPLFPEYDRYQWGVERIHVGAGQNVSVLVTHDPAHGGPVLGGGTLR